MIKDLLKIHSLEKWDYKTKKIKIFSKMEGFKSTPDKKKNPLMKFRNGLPHLLLLNNIKCPLPLTKL